jgi:hypothetical protein
MPAIGLNRRPPPTKCNLKRYAVFGKKGGGAIGGILSKAKPLISQGLLGFLGIFVQAGQAAKTGFTAVAVHFPRLVVFSPRLENRIILDLWRETHGFVNGCMAKLGASVASVTFVSSTQITVTDPGGTAGTVASLTVTNPNGQSATLPNGSWRWTWRPPPWLATPRLKKAAVDQFGIN